MTGERSSLAATAVDLARRLKAVTDARCSSASACPTPTQAREASTVADGVIQGASVVRRLLDGGPEAVGAYVAEVRAALDELER